MSIEKQLQILCGGYDFGERQVTRTVATKVFTYSLPPREVEKILLKVLIERLGEGDLPANAIVEISPAIHWGNQDYDGYDVRVELPIGETS